MQALTKEDYFESPKSRRALIYLRVSTKEQAQKDGDRLLHPRSTRCLST